MKRMRRTLLYLALTGVAAALLLYAFIPPAAEVDVARVTRGPLEVTVNDDGKTRIKERYVVSTPLDGELLRIELHAGDKIQAGKSLLAVIEPRDPSLLDVRSKSEAEARVKAAEARRLHAETQLERARATQAHAQADQARLERLLPMGATTQEVYDAAVLELRTAGKDVQAGQFGVQIAEFELQQAQAALLRTNRTGTSAANGFEIRSPISGEVLRVFQKSATMVPAGTRLVELGDPENLEVEVDVLSSEAVRIVPGAKMYLEHWGLPKPLIARVRLVEPQAFLKVSALGVEEQRVNVIADFVDPPEARRGLGDAYRVEARIVTWQADDVLKVNAGALFRNQSGWAVYRIVGGRAKRTPVEIGHSNGMETQVIRGLQVDDEVVAYPSDQIRDGVRVVARPTSP